MELDLLDALLAGVFLALFLDLCGAGADAGVGGVDVVGEELVGLVVLRLDALEEEGDAVAAAELAAVLEEEACVDAGACVAGLAFELCVEGLDEEAVCFLFGEEAWVRGEEGEAGGPVAAGDVCEFLGEGGGFDVVAVVVVEGGAFLDVGVCAGGLACVGALGGGPRGVEQLDGGGFGLCGDNGGGGVLLLDVGEVEAVVDVVACDVALVLCLELCQLREELLLEAVDARLVVGEAGDEGVQTVALDLLLVHLLLHRVHQAGHHLRVAGLVLDVLVDALRGWRGAVVAAVAADAAHDLHQALEDDLVGAVAVLGLVALEGGEQLADALGEPVVDDALILERLDLVAAAFALGVDLVLLGADEGLLVDVGVHFDVAIVGELEGVLGGWLVRGCALY